jgi:hypothetical protein
MWQTRSSILKAALLSLPGNGLKGMEEDQEPTLKEPREIPDSPGKALDTQSLSDCSRHKNLEYQTLTRKIAFSKVWTTYQTTERPTRGESDVHSRLTGTWNESQTNAWPWRSENFED